MTNNVSHLKRYKVLALPRYNRSAASSRLRHYILGEELQALGFDVDFSPFFSDGYVQSLYNRESPDRYGILQSYISRAKALFKANRYDIVWAEKELLPTCPGLLQAMSCRSVPYVLDFDDNWLARYEERFSFSGDFISKVMLASLLKNAAAITVSNSTIAQQIHEISEKPEITIIPGIPEPLSNQIRDSLGRARDGRNPPVIGWIGSPMTAESYLPQVADLLQAKIKAGEISVLLIGAGQAVPQLKADRRQWSEETQYSDLMDIDIGIMPLTQTRFSESKSSFKLKQYLSLGKCFVASPIATSVELTKNSGAGLLADDGDQWRAAIERLVKDKELRTEMSRRAIEYSDRQPTLRTYAEAVEAVFENCLRAS